MQIQTQIRWKNKMCLPYLWTFHVCVIESSIIFQLCSFRVVHLTYLTLPSLIEVWPPRTQFSKIQTSFPRKILGERFMATPHGKESTNIPPTALGLGCFTSNIPLLRYREKPPKTDGGGTPACWRRRQANWQAILAIFGTAWRKDCSHSFVIASRHQRGVVFVA